MPEQMAALGRQVEARANLDWQIDALCRETDPESFFPDKGQSTRQAKQVCMACEVRTDCLEYALATGERFGIWGGLSERERRRVIKCAAGGAGWRREQRAKRRRHPGAPGALRR